MTWARWTLIAQLAFFLGWIGLEESRRIPAATVLLETVPVDPRDLWSGQYLTLTYPIAWLDRTPGFPKPAPTRPVQMSVRLVPVVKNAKGAARSQTVWRPAECRIGAPPIEKPTAGVWVTGTWLGRGPGVDYGIGRYYFSESRMTEMNSLVPGTFAVECAISQAGRLTIRRIVE